MSIPITTAERGLWGSVTVANKFHEGNGDDGRHYWLTPPDLYAALDAEFHFDFDPCPYPLPDGFDGLTCEWGRSNYVNPPFGTIVHNGKIVGPTAWVRKAIKEYHKGKTVVFVWPRDKWELMLVSAAACGHVRNLGDVRWCAIEDGRPGPGTGRHIAAFILTAGMSGKSFAESAEELDKALADVRRELVAAVPPRVIGLARRAAQVSFDLTPPWPAWLRAALGTFALLEGIVVSHGPDPMLGLPAALFGLWLAMGALRD